jgi:hypothetical protein
MATGSQELRTLTGWEQQHPHRFPDLRILESQTEMETSCMHQDSTQSRFMRRPHPDIAQFQGPTGAGFFKSDNCWMKQSDQIYQGKLKTLLKCWRVL